MNATLLPNTFTRTPPSARSRHAGLTPHMSRTRRLALCVGWLIAQAIAPAVRVPHTFTGDLLAQATVRQPAKGPGKAAIKAPAKRVTPQSPSSLTVVVPPDVAPDSTHPYRPGVDVSHYAFTITLPRSGSEVTGRATISVGRRLTVDTLVLDLMSMTVDSVLVADKLRAYVRDSSSIRVPLLPADGAALTVSVVYHGAPGDGLIIRETPERGWSAFGDNWPNRARYWLPTIDHPSDKASVAWTIVAPGDMMIVANGVQKSQTPVTPGMTRTQYEIAAPIPTYLMVIAAARMTVTPLPKTCGVGPDGACIAQNVYTFPEEKSYAPGPFSEAQQIMQFFAKMAGPYAYEQLNHLQSATRFGGMENATAIFYSDAAFKKHDVGVQLIAHETAHQWFGDAVTPRRWQDLWLSEGFASYFAPLYIQSSRGDSAFRASMSTIRTQILAAPVVAARPVVDSVGAATPNELLNANSYQKGAFVLHMLRSDVGDDAFFKGIRDYQAQYRNGTATTANLRVAMEQAAGASLVPFFEQWLHRPGFPELAVHWTLNASARTVSFSVTQSARFGMFAVPLVVELVDANGQRERHTLHIQDVATQTFTQPLSLMTAPVSVLLDPEVELLARLALTGPAN